MIDIDNLLSHYAVSGFRGLSAVALMSLAEMCICRDEQFRFGLSDTISPVGREETAELFDALYARLGGGSGVEEESLLLVTLYCLLHGVGNSCDERRMGLCHRTARKFVDTCLRNTFLTDEEEVAVCRVILCLQYPYGFFSGDGRYGDYIRGCLARWEHPSCPSDALSLNVARLEACHLYSTLYCDTDYDSLFRHLMLCSTEQCECPDEIGNASDTHVLLLCRFHALLLDMGEREIPRPLLSRLYAFLHACLSRGSEGSDVWFRCLAEDYRRLCRQRIELYRLVEV